MECFLWVTGCSVVSLASGFGLGFWVRSKFDKQIEKVQTTVDSAVGAVKADIGGKS